MVIKEIKRYLTTGEYDYSLWRVDGIDNLETFAERREAMLYISVNSGEFQEREILQIFFHLYETELNSLCKKTGYTRQEFTKDIFQTTTVLLYLHKHFQNDENIIVPFSAFYRIIL